MAEEPADSSAAAALRRSKRNKFHLDVRRMHSTRSPVSPAQSRTPPVATAAVIPAPVPVPAAIVLPVPAAAARHVPLSLPPMSSVIVVTPSTSIPPPKKTPTPPVSAPAPSAAPVAKPSASRSEASKTPESTTGGEEEEGRSSGGSGNDSGEVRCSTRKRKAPVLEEFSYSVDSEIEDEEMEEEGMIVPNATQVGAKTPNSASKYKSAIGEYPCPRCPAFFETRVGLTNHLKLHGANKTFSCVECDFSCTNRKTMRQHKRVHGPTAPAGIIIPAKKRKSIDVKKPSPLTVDNLLGGDGKKPKRFFPCPWCPFKTRTFARLVPHKLGHFRVRGFQCAYCTFRAGSCSFLISHVAQYHRNESNGIENEGLPVYMAADSPDMPALPVKLTRIEFEPERRLRICGDCGFETRLRGLFERHRRHKHGGGRRQTTATTQKSLQNGKSEQTKTTTTEGADTSTRNFSTKTESIGNKPILKRRLCPQCNASFSNEGQYRCHFARRHAPNRRANRPHCVAMLQERLGKPEFSEVLTAENKDPNEFIGHVAALGPQSMIGELIAGLTVYKCAECPYSTDVRGRLNNHMKRHNAKESDFEPNTPIFRCTLCSYIVGRLDRFLRHWTLHGVDELPPCIALPEGMSVQQALASIAAAAAVPPTPEKKQRSTEPRMPAQAAATTATPAAGPSTTPSASAGGRSDLKKDLVLRCQQCPYRSKHGCDMKAHQKMHCDRGTFHCHYCTYSTMRLNALKTHVALHKEERAGSDRLSAPTPDQPMVQKLPEKDREAEFLPKEVVLSKLYDDSNTVVIGRRMMRSNGSIFYRCIHCPFETKYPSLLNPHARYHNRGAKYRCPKCSYSTDRDDVLPRHIDSHQNEPAPEGGWFCSACPYRTDSYGKQWHHVQKHKKVGRYNCDICKYGVGSLQSLNDHMALHGIVKLGSIVKVAPSAPTTIAALAEVVAEKQKRISPENSDTTTDISNERGSPADTVASSAGATGSASDKEKSEETGVAFGNDFELDMDWSGAAAATTSKVEQAPPAPTVKVTRARAVATAAPVRTATPPTTRGRGKGNGRGRAAAPVRPAAAPGPFKSNIRLELPPMPDALKPKRRRLNGANQTAAVEEESEKVHVCKHCPFTSMDTKMLKLHTRMHEGERPQSCSMCSFSCFTTEALFTHYNVHAPQLPDSMLASMKRKLAARKRNGSLLGREILPANSANVFECQQCNNFRTACQDRFLQHRMEHVQTIQQRLMTQLKRAAVDDSRKNKGVKKKLERKWLQNYCTKCCFRCDTVVALMNHLEYHDNPNNVFKCRFCDYSANSSDVVNYHENTHHLDLPTTNQIMNAVAVNGVVDADLVAEARQKYSCGRCGFYCHELVDCIGHFEVDHATDPLLSQIIGKLRMGLMPTGITVTFVGADDQNGKETGVVGDQQSPNVLKASK